MVKDTRFLDEPSDKVDYMVMTDTTMIDRLKEFMECEGRSCSFDPELITPEYVYRMWGGAVAIEEIATGLKELRNQDFMNV